MHAHLLGSVLKIILGLGMFWGLYNFVNVYEQPVLGLSFLFVAIFLTTWGITYFLFVRWYKIFARPYSAAHSSKSYYLGIWAAMFMIITTSLMISGQRSPAVGLLLALGFIVLHTLFTQGGKWIQKH